MLVRAVLCRWCWLWRVLGGRCGGRCAWLGDLLLVLGCAGCMALGGQTLPFIPELH